MYLANRLLDSLSLFIATVSGYKNSRMMDLKLIVKDCTIAITRGNSLGWWWVLGDRGKETQSQ